jgi:hypothetical protein
MVPGTIVYLLTLLALFIYMIIGVDSTTDYFAIMRKFKNFKELKKWFFEERKPWALKKCVFVGSFFMGLPLGLCLILIFWKEIKENIYYTPWKVIAKVLCQSLISGFLWGCVMHVFGVITLKLKEKRARKKEGRVL